MQRFLNSILLLLFSVNGICQIKSANGFDTVVFINQIVKDNRSHIYMYEDIHPNTIVEIQNRIVKGKFVRRLEDQNGKNISDSIVLNKSELKELLHRLNALKNFHWTDQTSSHISLGRVKLIRVDTEGNLYEGSIKYQILPPLMFRDDNYCFFYYDYSCGTLCGHGQLVIYKKERKSWKHWWTLLQWDE